jgi:YfiH family protein
MSSRRPNSPPESAAAIGAVDAILAGVGLQHGTRSTRIGSWKGGERVRLPKSSTGAESVRSNLRAPGLVLVAGWERFPWLRAAFSTRQGGQTTTYSLAEPLLGGGPAGEHNLGWTAQDDPAIVAENRRRFLAAVAGLPKSAVQPALVTLRQFHSGLIRTIHSDTRSPLATPDGLAVLRGDGLLTDAAGLMLGIQTADCVPVLIADTRTRAVAAFHAGWRGTLARIVERGVGTMRREFGSRPQDLVAAIGPAIRDCCFAVGEEVRFEFESQFAYAPELFSEVYDSDPVRDKYPLLFLTARAPGHSNIGPQIHLDLHEANRRQLLDAGLKAKAISVIAECTACARMRDGRRKYFSHRAESGFTGRMLSVIGTRG